MIRLGRHGLPFSSESEGKCCNSSALEGNDILSKTCWERKRL
jgi:hypothetical protein